MTQRMYDKSTGKMTYVLPSATQFSKSQLSLIAGTYYNSFKNISAALGNNVISGTFPHSGTQVAWGPCTLDDGFYSISDINNALWNFFIVNKLYMVNASGENVYFAQIMVNPITYVVELDTFLIPTAAQMTLNGWTQPPGGAINISGAALFWSGSITISAPLAVMLGATNSGGFTTTVWNSLAWTGSPGGGATNGVPFFGVSAPSINPVTSVLVRCNLVCSYVGNPTDLLCQVPVVSAYGSINQFQAPYPTFSSVIDAQFSTIELSFMDQNLNTLYFFDPELTFTLQIKHI